MVRAVWVGDQPHILRCGKWDVAHQCKSKTSILDRVRKRQQDAENAANSLPVPLPAIVTDVFRQLSKEEYDRLSLEEKLSYLQMLMGDIREKSDEARRAMETQRQTKKEHEGS